MSQSKARTQDDSEVSVEMYNNPFRLPKDDDVFEMRDREKATRNEERKKKKNQKIWERSVNSPYKLLVKSNIQKTQKKKSKVSGKRPTKENLPNFIAKKRDMFLMQMSLNTKQAEIKKLVDKAQMKDEALERSEKMLEEDASKFDEFLKKNDQEAHKAFKAAGREIKDKREKIEELKKLNIETTKIENEISKLKDRLKECEKYKTFLLEVSNDGRADDEEDGNANPNTNAIDSSRKLKEAETRGEALPFSTPEQLLSIFAQKEEENLFLIQVIQRMEEDLDQLRRRYHRTMQEMRNNVEEVQSNIKELDSKINSQTSKINSLKSSIAVVEGDDMDERKDIMGISIRWLDSKIKHVYDSCFKDLEPDSLTQLKEIEVRVDSLIDSMLAIPVMHRKFLEQRKENQRRAKNREKKKAEVEKANADRAEKAKARARAETHRRVGKPLMPRVRFGKHKKKAEKKDEITDEGKLDHIKYFTDSVMT